uniref:hypothetical protein n=1 Tax=Methylobacterium sp. B34 TaxID=95563 RepID=UPI000FE140A3|nr:hypothetical protein [Methylobacterium sp. B34]
MNLQEFAAAAAQGPDATLDYYVKNYQSVHRVLRNKLLRKGEVRLEAPAGIGDEIAVSLIMNDITSVSFRDRGGMKLTILQGPGIIETFGSLQLKIYLPNNQTEAFKRAVITGELAPTFLMPDTDAVSLWLSELQPLIESGRVLPRPERALMHLEAELPDGNRRWSMVAAAPHSPSDAWVLNDDNDRSEEVIKIEAATPLKQDEKELLEVLLPFIKGVKLADLNLILDDEHDVIEEFRIALKDIVREACDKGQDVDQIIQDILRPKVAKMHRRFQHITNMNSMKLGTAIVGTAVMGLISVQSGGMTAALTALGGAGGLGLVVKEATNAYDAEAAMRDESLYLLWRLSRRRS